MVALRITTERCGHRALEVAQLGLHGAHPPVELALGAELREVGAKMCLGETPEVALASEARPLGEDGQGDDLGIGKKGRAAGSGWFRSVLELPPVVHEHVQ
jgi:hypothetical protein